MGDPALGVTELLQKYSTMRAMRLRAKTHPEEAPKAQMAALARRFPGALREIDQLPMHEIEFRIEVLQRARDDGASMPPWGELQWGYHSTMRASLRIKRLVAACADPATAMDRAKSGYRAEPGDPSLEQLGGAQAAWTIRRPPQGRLHPWVLSLVAERYRVDPGTVETALFGLHAPP